MKPNLESVKKPEGEFGDQLRSQILSRLSTAALNQTPDKNEFVDYISYLYALYIYLFTSYGVTPITSDTMLTNIDGTQIKAYDLVKGVVLSKFLEFIPLEPELKALFTIIIRQQILQGTNVFPNPREIGTDGEHRLGARLPVANPASMYEAVDKLDAALRSSHFYDLDIIRKMIADGKSDLFYLPLANLFTTIEYYKLIGKEAAVKAAQNTQLAEV